ncbi:MAG: hypothetical protein LPK45_12515 [Bacteroidota bacterium]|nr:hypothetical protein [Bacteroidota bacterium]MDX5431928.1 hypothetical protein [Bacteroidota bacterium]MDX5470646.1 hypothetical protein [Bacteroidota bacterium]
MRTSWHVIVSFIVVFGMSAYRLSASSESDSLLQVWNTLSNPDTSRLKAIDS